MGIVPCLAPHRNGVSDLMKDYSHGTVTVTQLAIFDKPQRPRCCGLSPCTDLDHSAQNVF